MKAEKKGCHQERSTITMTVVVVKTQFMKCIDRQDSRKCWQYTKCSNCVSGLNISSGGESNLFAINNALQQIKQNKLAVIACDYIIHFFPLPTLLCTCLFLICIPLFHKTEGFTISLTRFLSALLSNLTDQVYIAFHLIFQ